jgi:hypothetical protein
VAATVNSASSSIADDHGLWTAHVQRNGKSRAGKTGPLNILNKRELQVSRPCVLLLQLCWCNIHVIRAPEKIGQISGAFIDSVHNRGIQQFKLRIHNTFTSFHSVQFSVLLVVPYDY